MIEGVEACSVANRSGVGAEADMLQPVIKAQMSNVKINLVLISFNGFKETLLAGQNLCANTATIGTGYLFIKRVIFLKASHTLHLGMFRKCAQAEFCPMDLNGGWVKFGDFAEGDVNCGDML